MNQVGKARVLWGCAAGVGRFARGFDGFAPKFGQNSTSGEGGEEGERKGWGVFLRGGRKAQPFGRNPGEVRKKIFEKFEISGRSGADRVRGGVAD